MKTIKGKAGDAKIVLWEHPAFCGKRHIHLKLNKLRLVYQRYLCELFVARNPSVAFLSCDKDVDAILHQYRNVRMFDPVDKLVEADVVTRFGKSNVDIVETPMFLMSRSELIAYHVSKHGKRLRHAPFYKFVRSKIHILEGVKSQDKFNREPFKGDTLPPEPYPKYRRTALHKQCMKNAIDWVTSSTQYKNNLGEVDPDYLLKLPSDTNEARAWLDKFVNDRLGSFGKYQDAIVLGSNFVYHSGLSIPMNYGLITPGVVVSKIREHFERQGDKTEMNNYEGFVRQVIGWREYCRLYYVCVPEKTYNINHFNMPSQTLGTVWYTGKTCMNIVDEAIVDAWKFGYLHHIRRLMIMSNYMTLCNVHPDQIYRWMYEFSLDSNDVFMVFNCYSMGSYSDGGLATHKPYISGSGYVKRQGRLKAGRWEDVWTKKYRDFLKRHKVVIR